MIDYSSVVHLIYFAPCKCVHNERVVQHQEKQHCLVFVLKKKTGKTK